MKNLLIKSSLLAAVSLALVGCSDDDDNNNNAPSTAQFEVTVTNLTAAQPFSPVLLVAHSDGWNAFADGSRASDGIEVMAESGSPADLRSEAQAQSQYISSAVGSAPQGPASVSQVYTLDVPANKLADLELTMATMLVNTNDAFTAVNGGSLAGLDVGMSRTFNTPTWDSGTEANSETAATIPGPAGNGASAGFDATRDDVRDEVHFHQGVITQDDGLATSVLTQVHRFDNPTARVIVKRVR